MAPVLLQASIWTKGDLLYIGHIRTNFSESKFFIQEIELENTIFQMAARLSWHGCVKWACNLVAETRAFTP